jgi:hypothetical protein
MTKTSNYDDKIDQVKTITFTEPFGVLPSFRLKIELADYYANLRNMWSSETDRLAMT